MPEYPGICGEIFALKDDEEKLTEYLFSLDMTFQGFHDTINTVDDWRGYLVGVLFTDKLESVRSIEGSLTAKSGMMISTWQIERGFLLTCWPGFGNRNLVMEEKEK